MRLTSDPPCLDEPQVYHSAGITSDLAVPSRFLPALLASAGAPHGSWVTSIKHWVCKCQERINNYTQIENPTLKDCDVSWINYLIC